MKKFAYAKINLTLEIIGRKKNGYHLIKSIFQKISLHDTIVIHNARQKEVEFTNLSVKGKTTIDKTIEIFERETSIPVELKITVQKNIPIRSGLGGGSSDAATLLRMLNEWYGHPLSKEKMRKLSAEIGADVPFFLNGNTAVVEGIGEKIKPIKANTEDYFALIAMPYFGYSTKSAYLLFDKFGNLKEKGSTEKLANCLRKNCTEMENYLYNDFEAIYERFDKRFVAFKKNLETIAGKKFLLTGSGSALFTIYKSKAPAEDIHKKFLNREITSFLAQLK